MTGAQVKKTMADLGYTQQQLAEGLGVDRNTVNRWANDLMPIPKIAELAMQALHASNGKRRKKEKIKQ